MKRIIILFLAGLCLMACTKEEDDGIRSLSAEIQNYNFYDAEWIVDRQVVGHTQLCLDTKSGVVVMVELFPSQSLFAWVNGNASFPEPHDKADGADGGDGFVTIGAMAGNSLDLFNTGNSSTSFYYATVSDSSNHKIIINDKAYNVKLQYEDGTPTAVYEAATDKWTVTWKITAVTLENVYNPEEVITHTYQPTFTMMLLTTKRIK